MNMVFDVVTKAGLDNEAMEKLRSVTQSKLIHILVDYFAKMEKILAEMRTLFTSLNLAPKE